MHEVSPQRPSNNTDKNTIPVSRNMAFSFFSRNALLSSVKVASVYKNSNSYFRCNRREFSIELQKVENGSVHSDFLSKVAQFTPPKEINALFQLLKLTGSKFVEPTNRKNVNPFLVPITLDKNGEKLCYLRWPTQRDTMELQLVRTTKVGVELVALNTVHYCQRLVTELEFYSDPSVKSAINILQANGISFQPDGYSALMKSGKFPVQTVNDQRLLLDRYLLTKIAAFPDCYERLAHNHMENNNSVSALVTCERMIALFSSWARPMHFHSKMLHRLGNRPLEVKESATAAMGLPLWTLAADQEVRCVYIYMCVCDC